MRPILLALLLVQLVLSQPASAAEDPKAVLQKAIAAAGGRGAVNRAKGPMMWMEKGTFHGMGSGQPFIGQYASKWPHWYRQEIENAFAIAVNGDKAWMTQGDTKTPLSGTQLTEQLHLARIAWATRLFPLLNTPYTLKSIEGVQVDGKPTVGIQADYPQGRPLRLYFDAKSYVLVKLETKVISPQHGPQPVLSESFFSQHRSFGAGKVPGKIKLFYDKKLFVEAEVVDYKTGATLDPEHFEDSQ